MVVSERITVRKAWERRGCLLYQMEEGSEIQFLGHRERAATAEPWISVVSTDPNKFLFPWE